MFVSVFQLFQRLSYRLSSNKCIDFACYSPRKDFPRKVIDHQINVMDNIVSRNEARDVCMPDLVGTFSSDSLCPLLPPITRLWSGNAQPL